MSKEKHSSPPLSSHEITNKFVLPLWNERAVEVVDSFFSSTADIRTTFLTGRGPEPFKKSVYHTFEAFPNLEMYIEDVMQHGNKLLYKWQAQALHEGPLLGLPASGQMTHFSGLVYGEFEEDKISVYHSFSNIPQILRSVYMMHQHINRPEFHSDILVELRKLTDITLTRREIECLCHWLRGCSIKESAKNMGGLSERTVQTYRETIKLKFNAKNFQNLISILQQNGVMTLLLNWQVFTS